MLCITQFQQIGTIYAQIGIDVSNQKNSNVSAITLSRHTPLPSTKTMYSIRTDMNLKYLVHCIFQHWPNKSNFFSHSGKIADIKEPLTRSQ